MEHLECDRLGLSQEQSETLEALLSSNTKEEAAAKLGISRSTLYRRLADAELKAAYRAARSEAIAGASARLQLAAETAVAALVDIVTDGSVNPHVRVTAARGLLEMAYKSFELEDLEARLEELEEAVA